MNLFHELGKKNLQATGTLRVNWTDKCPVTSVEKMKKMERWAYNYRQDLTTEIMITRWNDNSVVKMPSNCPGV